MLGRQNGARGPFVLTPWAINGLHVYEITFPLRPRSGCLLVVDQQVKQLTASQRAQGGGGNSTSILKRSLFFSPDCCVVLDDGSTPEREPLAMEPSSSLARHCVHPVSI